MTSKTPALASINRVRRWVIRLAGETERPAEIEFRAKTQRPAKNAVKGAGFKLTCVVIFLTAMSVRILYWQDMRSQIMTNTLPFWGLTELYQLEATRIVEEGRLLFPDGPVDSSDARMIVHPPGYSILMAAISSPGARHTALRLIQIIVDSAAAVVIVLIASELLPATVGIIAGLLVALSPHFAYYSMLLLPDSMSAMPILLAVFCIVRASKRPRLITVIIAGALVGLSCWLRPNALLLAPLLALLTLAFFEPATRLRYSAALIGSAILVIAPITIRNLVVYGRFIPLSVGAGLNLMEGIADYDRENLFDLPVTDLQTVNKEAEWSGKPEYARNLWMPDGVTRDRDRFARAAAVVRENPGWFLSVILRRMTFMLRYNDFNEQNRPNNTTMAPTISAAPSFGHGLPPPDSGTKVWSASPVDLIDCAAAISPIGEVSLIDGGQAVRISGDNVEGRDSFTSAPIPLDQKTDYVLRVVASVEQGKVSIKVQPSDPRIVLGVAPVPEADRRASKRARKGQIELDSSAPVQEPGTTVVEIPFASGNATDARLVLSNDQTTAGSMVQIRSAELFALGPTPHLWTRYPRSLIGALQKNVFKTQRLLPLIAVGVLLLVVARRWQALVLLTAVPAYYLVAQSLLHTEYRYTLVIHYFLFVLSAVTLYASGIAWANLVRRIRNKAPVL